MARQEYEFVFAGKNYVAFHEMATSIAMVERRINEIISGTRLFSSYAMRKDLLLNLSAQKNRLVIEGILSGGIREVGTETILRKAA